MLPNENFDIGGHSKGKKKEKQKAKKKPELNLSSFLAPG